MSGVQITEREQEELYVILKPRETEIGAPLEALLRRVEKALFERLTIAEIEALTARFPPGR